MNHSGQCNIPALEEGTTYIFAVAGVFRIIFLRSDGVLVGIGEDPHGTWDVPWPGPPMPDSVRFVPPVASQPVDFVVQLDHNVRTEGKVLDVVCLAISGEELARWDVTDELTLVKDSVALKVKPGSRRLWVVLPDNHDNRSVSPDLTWKELRESARGAEK